MHDSLSLLSDPPQCCSFSLMLERLLSERTGNQSQRCNECGLSLFFVPRSHPPICHAAKMLLLNMSLKHGNETATTYSQLNEIHWFDMDMKFELHMMRSVYIKRSVNGHCHGCLRAASSKFCSWRQSSALTPDHHQSPSRYLLCLWGPTATTSLHHTHSHTRWLDHESRFCCL